MMRIGGRKFCTMAHTTAVFFRDFLRLLRLLKCQLKAIYAFQFGARARSSGARPFGANKSPIKGVKTPQSCRNRPTSR